MKIKLLLIFLFLLGSANALELNSTTLESSLTQYAVYVNETKSVVMDDLVIKDTSIELYNLSYGGLFRNMNETNDSIINFYGLDYAAPYNDIRYVNETLIKADASQYNVTLIPEDEIEVGSFVVTGLGNTISAWAYMENAANFPIITKFGTAGNREWDFSTDSLARLRFRVYDSDDDYIGRLTSNLTSYEDQWIHAVATYDSSYSINLFLNELRSDTSTDNSGNFDGPHNTTTNVTIGRRSGVYADGSIDQIQLYNKLLSQGEISELYNQTSTSFILSEDSIPIYNFSTTARTDPVNITARLNESIDGCLEIKMEDDVSGTFNSITLNTTEQRLLGALDTGEIDSGFMYLNVVGCSPRLNATRFNTVFSSYCEKCVFPTDIN